MFYHDDVDDDDDDDVDDDDDDPCIQMTTHNTLSSVQTGSGLRRSVSPNDRLRRRRYATFTVVATRGSTMSPLPPRFSQTETHQKFLGRDKDRKVPEPKT